MKNTVLTSSVILAGLSATLSAQVPSPQPDNNTDETIVLSPFEVRADSDEGYRVQNAVSTTGFAQDLLKTPLPITVVTSEFLRDAGLHGFNGALSYVSGVALDDGMPNGNFSSGFGRGNVSDNVLRFRGQPYNGTYRNGLRQLFGFDTDNVDRIEIAKGPMAVFVGGATLGGEVNVVTKQPLFKRQQEMSVRIGEYDSYRVSADLTGPITKNLAYRFIASYDEGNTWRLWSHSRKLFVNPQLLWNITPKLTTRLDAVYSKLDGNLVSPNTASTQNFQSAFDNPPQALLDLGRRRTGDLAGVPFTVDEYRTRIGQSFGVWRQDIYDATGRWVSLGDGEGLYPTRAREGKRYNFFGPHAGRNEPTTMVESETRLELLPWWNLRAIGRYTTAKVEHDSYTFSIRQQPAGNHNLSYNLSSTRVERDSWDGKIESVMQGKIGPSHNSLLIGTQYLAYDQYAEDADMYDFSRVPSVPGSPNVYKSPATLTGYQVYQYFDPAFHSYPDTRLITNWRSDTQPDGAYVYDFTKEINHGAYVAMSSGWFKDRLVATGGARRSWLYSRFASADRNKNILADSNYSQPNVATDSYMAGLILEVRQGLNLYASYNRGETARSGSLVSRVTFSDAPSDIVSSAEQAAHPVPNTLGTGIEAGIKFELLDRKLTGSVGWFQLKQGNILVQDWARDAADPRNVGTEVDPNPATANPAVRYRVLWQTPINGNTTEGFETDLVWTPIPSYSVVVGASTLTTNEQTVIKPLTNDAASQRTYAILNGRPLPNSPDHMVRVFQNYRFQEGFLKGFNVGLGVRYQSESQPLANEVNWGIVSPAHTVFNMVVGYKTKIYGRETAFQLEVNNLTNKVYFEGERVYGAPREFALTTTVKF